MLARSVSWKKGIGGGLILGALLAMGGGPLFATVPDRVPNPTQPGIPAPRVFTGSRLTIPSIGQPVPRGITPAVMRSQAITDALGWLAPLNPGTTLHVTAISLVSQSEVEAQLHFAAASMPPYLWQISVQGPLQLPTGRASQAVLYVGANDGHVWLTHVPSSASMSSP